MTDWGDVPAYPYRTDEALRNPPPPLPPLTLGAEVAWTETTVGGVTDGISDVHLASDEAEKALCGAWIPTGDIRRLPIVRRMRRCGRCQHALAQRQYGVGA